MLWRQQELSVGPKPNGFHIITDTVVAAMPEIEDCEAGLLHLFIQHTSASLAINENADPDVRGDLLRHFENSVPRNASYYRHTLEGDDDMPAHIKAVTIGTELTIPVRGGSLALGSWQGVYLCEHRDNAGARTLILTLQGRERATA